MHLITIQPEATVTLWKKALAAFLDANESAKALLAKSAVAINKAGVTSVDDDPRVKSGASKVSAKTLPSTSGNSPRTNTAQATSMSAGGPDQYQSNACGPRSSTESNTGSPQQ